MLLDSTSPVSGISGLDLLLALPTASDTMEWKQRVEKLKAAANAEYGDKRFFAAISGYSEAIDLCEVIQTPPCELLSILLSNRAAAKLGCQDYTGAVEDAQAASRLDRKNIKAYYREADALRHLGAKHHLAGALQAAGKALAVEPHNQQMRELTLQVTQLYEQAGSSLALLDPVLTSELPASLKPAVEMFKAAEHRYLHSFSRDRKRLWTEGAPPDEFVPHHFYHYGQVALTLAGVKPVTLFAHGTDRDYGREIATTVMRPVVQRFQLEQKGFQLLEVQHKMLTDNPKHPGFQGNWILVNTNHPEFDLVKSVFLQPRPGYRVPELEIGRALGYPLPYGGAQISYMDETEAQVHGLCCVPLLEFDCPKHLGIVEWNLLSRHYLQCQRVFALLGRSLSFDESVYEQVHTYKKWLDAVQFGCTWRRSV